MQQRSRGGNRAVLELPCAAPIKFKRHSSLISAPVRSRSAFDVRRYRRELRVASAKHGLRGHLNHLRRASAAFGTASCHDLARLCGGGVVSSLILPRPAPYATFGSIDPNRGCLRPET